MLDGYAVEAMLRAVWLGMQQYIFTCNKGTSNVNASMCTYSQYS
jgi:hypothetical protein